MVTLIVPCPHCQRADLVLDGKAPDGRQRYRCRDCGRRSREAPRSNAHPADKRATVLRAAHERASLRGVARLFGVSRNTVSDWLKKAPPSCPN